MSTGGDISPNEALRELEKLNSAGFAGVSDDDEGDGSGGLNQGGLEFQAFDSHMDAADRDNMGRGLEMSEVRVDDMDDGDQSALLAPQTAINDSSSAGVGGGLEAGAGGGGGGGGGNGDGAAGASVWSLRYYQGFFDVNQKTVAKRLLRTLTPWAGAFYQDDAKPDLYGPFWITTTLIFLMASAGNFATYIEWAFIKHDDDDDKDPEAPVWRSNISKLTVASSVLYSVITLVPLVVWVLLGRLGHQKSLTEIMSIYGYSLFLFVPAQLICVVPHNLLQWVAVGVSFGFSVYFLLRNLWNYLELPPEQKKKGTALLATIFCAHGALALLMKVYFFA